MDIEYTNDYLLDKKIKILQPVNGYRASSDAVLLASAVNGKLNQAKILDVGAGTGAISLCLAHRLQEFNPQIYGLEVQPELVELANLSAAKNNFSNMHFLQADIRSKINNPEIKPCSFDVVISNPPYSENDMPSPNISKATAHNHHDFDLARWLAFCLKMTKPFGHIYIINRAEALPEICAFFNGKAGHMLIVPIHSKSKQKAKRVIVALQKDSKAPCQIWPTFITHTKDGSYTAQAQKVLRQGIGLFDLI